MLDLATIRAMNAEAAKVAAREHREPYIPYDAEEIESYRKRSIPFPNLGDYRPKGWKLVDSLFCDISGLGSPDETALTRGQLVERILDLSRRGTYAYALIEVGEFQAYLGVFKRTSRISLRK
jgi:hypothetical protein